MTIINLLLMIQVALSTIPFSNQARTFINVHNYYRASVNPPAIYMPAMQWSANLSNSSNTWATRCVWQHSGTPNVGENLYATTQRVHPLLFKPSDSVNSWGEERIYYSYATNSCIPGKVCGHYTQVVWDNSVNTGCAFQDCPQIQGLPWENGGTIVVCQYSPRGNWVGERPYEAA